MTRPNTILPYVAAAACIISLAAISGGMGYAIYDQRETNSVLCKQTVENRQAIRDTWNAARELILQGQSEGMSRANTNAFFDAVLRPIPPLECVGNQPVPKEET